MGGIEGEKKPGTADGGGRSEVGPPILPVNAVSSSSATRHPGGDDTKRGQGGAGGAEQLQPAKGRSFSPQVQHQPQQGEPRPRSSVEWSVEWSMESCGHLKEQWLAECGSGRV